MKIEYTELGYNQIEESKIEEINSAGVLINHIKSGAKIVIMKNEDDNKVFSISFKTPPFDSKGTPHILEHSVLCGSRKFPSKEPFVELAKGSLNTFLNAMTFSDKTMYPVASKNEKDFFNLMDVYLDAVFYPNIYSKPEIFKQEGWHYEIVKEGRESRLEISGVVYNEMKGAYSTPEELLVRKNQESLFPDTTYRYDSGGDPDRIPDLTYEEFINFHKRYYHPSNSFIFIYGDIDVQKVLKFLDKEYLSHFSRTDIDSTIEIQQPLGNIKYLKYLYPISETEDSKNKTYLSLNYAIGLSKDPILNLAFSIIEYLLLETPASPLKNALIKEGIGKDVFGVIETSIMQPYMSIVVKNSDEDKSEKFKDVVYNTLKKLVKDGIDKKLVEASINIFEFKLREADYRGLPKGLVYHIKMMESWLYDSDPFIHLRYDQHLNEIKRALTENYFEQLIDRYILNSNHVTFVTVKPDKAILKEKEKKLRQKLDEYFTKLSKEDKNKIIKEAEELKKRQLTPDPPEVLEKIPILSINDINKEAERLPIEIDKDTVGTFLMHPIFTSNIAYLNIFFDSTVANVDEIPYLSLLSTILTKVSTENYSYGELSNEININTGGISISSDAIGDKEDDTVYYPKLILKSKVTIKKFGKLLDLLKEIIFKTKFDEKERIREIIQESRSRLEMGIFEFGHNIVSNRLLSYFSPLGMYMEIMSGLSYYWFIRDLEKNFDKNFENVSIILKRLAEKLFTSNGIIVSITADTADLKKVIPDLKSFISNLSDEKIEKYKYKFNFNKPNEGLLSPANVQFVAKGYNFKRIGYKYSGGLMVLRIIASLDYLWNKIRVRGGAYGSFARFGRNGNMYFCSYRDPNLKETLEVYNGIKDYLEKFDPTDREMTKYIIGTISKLDHPLTPSMKGELASTRYISGITHEDIQREREEVLSTDKNTIKSFKNLVGDTMEKGYCCVLGNENKIRENKDVFDKLVNVFN